MIRFLVLFGFLAVGINCRSPVEISDVTSITKNITFVRSPYSFYEYVFDEPSGNLVYVHCDRQAYWFGSEWDGKMVCNVSVMTSFESKTCTTEFSHEPKKLLKMMNDHYAFRHKVILLNPDRVLLVKNSWSAGVPVWMELVVIQMPVCKVKVVKRTTNLEPYLYPRGNLFYVVHFDRNNTMTKLTYDEYGAMTWEPSRLFFSEKIWNEPYSLIEPTFIGASDQAALLRVFKSDASGNAYNVVYKGGFENITETLINTNNSIMASSVGPLSTPTFCWLSVKNTTVCQRYDTKGNKMLSIDESFFDDSIPWEVQLPKLNQSVVRNKTIDYFKSRQLKMHCLQNNELLLVAINKVSRVVNNTYLESRIESFEMVQVDLDKGNYTAPRKILIDDCDFQQVRVSGSTQYYSAENLHTPRVNIFEGVNTFCLGFWTDSRFFEDPTEKNVVTFTMKCFDKKYLRYRE